VAPEFLAYVLSFIYIAIYWNNHHHMFQVVRRVNGSVLWANNALLFFLSLVPFTTDWMGENHFQTGPVALYGLSLLMPAIAYYVLQQVIIRAEGARSGLAEALGADWKGRISPVFYLLGVVLAFYVPVVSEALYVLVALIWLIPDRRIERYLAQHKAAPSE